MEPLPRSIDWWFGDLESTGELTLYSHPSLAVVLSPWSKLSIKAERRSSKSRRLGEANLSCAMFNRDDQVGWRTLSQVGRAADRGWSHYCCCCCSPPHPRPAPLGFTPWWRGPAPGRRRARSRSKPWSGGWCLYSWVAKVKKSRVAVLTCIDQNGEVQVRWFQLNNINYNIIQYINCLLTSIRLKGSM